MEINSPVAQTNHPSSGQPIFAALRDALATLYPDEDDARVVVADTELDAKRIAFSARAQTNWHNILAEAMRQSRLDALLQIVSLPYGNNSAFQAAYEQYRHWINQGGHPDLLKPATSETEYTKIPSPPEPVKPPNIFGFIGREAELKTYAERLHLTGAVAVVGMPGVGKTTLAAALAKKIATEQQPIFWHTFYQGEDMRSMLWKLAAFLAHHGRDELWALLNNKDIPEPPLSSLLDYLFQQLKGKHFLLCLDDLHLLYDQRDDDPLLKKMLQRLEQAAQAGDVQVIVASRSTPQLRELVTSRPLAGLSAADTAALLQTRQINLPPDLQTALYTRTEGNAELLVLAIEALAHTSNPAKLIERLAVADNIEHYLLTEVDEQLDQPARSAMNGAAILLGYPGTSSAIEHVLESDNLRRTLTYLTNRYLLITQAGEYDKEYLQHAIVREFYYDLLGRTARITMHRRAAQFYFETEVDPLRAAQHLLRAGEIRQAAELVVRDVYGSLIRGQAARLSTCLAEISKQALSPSLTIDVKIAEAELHQFERNSSAAQSAAKTALALLAKIPASVATQQQTVQAHWILSRVLAAEDPAEALRYTQLALDLLEASDPLRAKFLIHQAALYGMRQELGQAEEVCQAGLALLAEDNLAERANALMNLGIVRSMLGDLKQGIVYFEEALSLSRQVGDPFRQLKVLANLAINQHHQGDWDSALDNMRQSYALAQRLGDIRHQAQVAGNLGDLLRKRCSYAEAQNFLEISLKLGTTAQLPLTIVNAHLNLAAVALAQKQWELATVALQAAEQRIDEYKLPNSRAELLYLQAQLNLARGQLTDAQQQAKSSCAEAQRLKLTVEEGVALRILGQILCAAEPFAEAIQLFEQSMNILEHVSHYEYALTQYQLGQCLNQLGNNEQAQENINKARTELMLLGAPQPD